MRECELELVVLSASKNCLGNKLLEKLLERINGCNMIVPGCDRAQLMIEDKQESRFAREFEFWKF